MKAPFFNKIAISLGFCLILGCQILVAQSVSQSDTLPTPFRKGRWNLGLSGIISSSANKIRGTDERSNTNRYGMSMDGGKFFKDRWLIGGIIEFSGTEFTGSADFTTETLFIGPLISRYFSPSSQGSLYLSLSPGYSRYRDFVSIEQPTASLEQSSSGDGFGIITSLGYSYVVRDRISFDIGFVISQSWFKVDLDTGTPDIEESDDIAISNVAFTFGFNILLEKLLQ